MIVSHRKQFAERDRWKVRIEGKSKKRSLAPASEPVIANIGSSDRYSLKMEDVDMTP
jgi:hypothetical protein